MTPEHVPAIVSTVAHGSRERVAVIAFANGEHLSVPASWVQDATGRVEPGQRLEVEIDFRPGWRRLPGGGYRRNDELPV